MVEYQAGTIYHRKKTPTLKSFLQKGSIGPLIRSQGDGEFAIAYDEGKLIGILMGTGGITTEIKHLVRVIHKDTGAKVLYDHDPRRLIRRLWQYYHREHYKHPSCFLNDRPLTKKPRGSPGSITE